MPRPIDATTAAALTGTQDVPAWLCEFQFASGTVRVCLGPETVTWNSATWTAVRGLLRIGAIAEHAETTGQHVPLEFGAVDTTWMTPFLQRRHRGREASIWRASYSTSSGALAGVPLLVARGRFLDGTVITEREETITVSTRLATRLIDLGQIRGVRCNQMAHWTAVPEAAAVQDSFFAGLISQARRPDYYGVPSAPRGTPRPPARPR